MTHTSYRIRAVERVCDILDLIQRQPDGMTLDEVTRVAKLPKSTAFRYLTELAARGYLNRDHTGRFLVGTIPGSNRVEDVSLQRAAGSATELDAPGGHE